MKIAILEKRIPVPRNCIVCPIAKSETRRTSDGHYFCGDYGGYVDVYTDKRSPHCNLVIVEDGEKNE